MPEQNLYMLTKPCICGFVELCRGFRRCDFIVLLSGCCARWAAMVKYTDFEYRAEYASINYVFSSICISHTIAQSRQHTIPIRGQSIGAHILVRANGASRVHRRSRLWCFQRVDQRPRVEVQLPPQIADKLYNGAQSKCSLLVGPIAIYG